MCPIDALQGGVQLVELTATAPAELLTQARELLLEYGQFVISQPAAARFCFGSLEKEAARLPLSFHEQGGGAMIGLVNDQPAGFVAWRRAPGKLAEDSWELKRLWVRPQGRGTGLGRALTQAVLDRAVGAGRKAVYLDTVPGAMTAALRLYLVMGFVPCTPYGDNPIEELEYLVMNLQPPKGFSLGSPI
jgi:GNAT superfamily N-acetyltransferase